MSQGVNSIKIGDHLAGMKRMAKSVAPVIQPPSVVKALTARMLAQAGNKERAKDEFALAFSLLKEEDGNLEATFNKVTELYLEAFSKQGFEVSELGL